MRAATAVAMAIEIERNLFSIRAEKTWETWTVAAETRLNNRLVGIFHEAEKDVIRGLEVKYGASPEAAAEARAQFLLQKAEYQNALSDSAIEAGQHGRTQTLEEIQRQGMRFAPRDFDQGYYDRIASHVFEASEQTMNRLAGDVMNNIAESHRQGLGIKDAADNLKSEFRNMRKYELTRVARTEINGHQNMGAHQTMHDLGIEYEQWWTAGDERVRGQGNDNANHIIMHAQITKTGDSFSNGLRHPGDRSGRIEEWIMCRCRPVPFLMPEGKAAPPGRVYFYEDDLMDIAGGDPENPLYDELEHKDEINKVFGGKDKTIKELDNLDRAVRDQAANMEVTMEKVIQENSRYITGNKTKWTQLTTDEKVKILDSLRTDADWRTVMGNIDKRIMTSKQTGFMDDALRQWVGSSTDPGGYAMQFSLERVGLSKGNTANVVKQLHMKNISHTTVKLAREIERDFYQMHKITRKAMDQAVTKEYLKTQAIYKELGISEIKAYRGIGGKAMKDVSHGAWQTYTPRGTESWSIQKTMAERFAGGQNGMVLEKTYKTSEIFSSQLTRHQFYEYEIMPVFRKGLFDGISNLTQGHYRPEIFTMAVKENAENNIISDYGFEDFLAAVTREKKRTGKDELSDAVMDKIAAEIRAQTYPEEEGPA